MTKTWIGTVPGMGRSIIDHDPRNLDYPARGVLFSASSPLRKRTHRRGRAYDQGPTPQCVAYTAKGMLNTAPFSAAEPYRLRSHYSTQEFYDGAQANDEWPGTDYDGTSARGVLRYLVSRGIITEYRWCFGIDDFLHTLSDFGPVSVGAYWLDGMWDPDENGLVAYEGRQAGGHQFQAIGIDPREEEVEFMNSWGTGWGDRGRFRMKFSEVEKMLADDADAHTLVAVS